MQRALLSSLAVLVLAGCAVQNREGDLQKKTNPISPQPQGCSSLDANACSANASCELTRASCPGCEADGTCANSTCMACRDKQPVVSSCEGLNETSCEANLLCRAVYDASDCAQMMPLDGGAFEPCPTIFSHCTYNLPPQDPCAGQPEELCVAPFCRPILGASMTVFCEADAGCTDEYPEPAYLGCQGNVSSCFSNCDCAVNEYCHLESVYPDPVTPAIADGGVARCMVAPTGFCRRVPGIDPMPVPAQDAGSAPSAP